MIVKFTKKEIKQFKKLYKKALKEDKQIFIFQKRKVLVSFAKYVLEYFKNNEK